VLASADFPTIARFSVDTLPIGSCAQEVAPEPFHIEVRACTGLLFVSVGGLIVQPLGITVPL
jgi:hypothetical protein